MSLQVAMARLRLEGIKFRELHRSEFDAWPFAEDRIVVLVRISTDSVHEPFYVMSDGIERTLALVMEFAPFYHIAMTSAGMWMSSGS